MQDRADGYLQAGRWKKRMRLIAGAAVLLAVVGSFLWMTSSGERSPSADERLAAFEAARAIPDFENAAVLYNRLLHDPNAATPVHGISKSVDAETIEQVIREPWLSKDHPELAAWVREYQPILDRLLEASQREKCCFPVIIDPLNTGPEDRARSMSQWGFLLRIAANNDVAEGRIDAALSKWKCLVQMGNHLRQQPVSFDHVLALEVGELALEPVARFLITGNPTETHLQQVEAMPLAVEDHWAEQGERICLTEALIWQRIVEKAEERFGLSYYLRHPVQILPRFRPTRGIKAMADRFGFASTYARGSMRDMYYEGMATARGIRVLAALRRYRNANARWPEGLDEIRSLLSEDALTDPFSRYPFVYRREADTFALYSLGPNCSDQDGPSQSDFTTDDLVIWPMIWPRWSFVAWPELDLPGPEPE